jgi:sec-independent protein translocase protein TatC
MLIQSSSFIDHLNELKTLAIKSFVVWLVGFAGAFVFNSQIVEIITKPVKDKGLLLHFLSPTDSFFYVIKICGFTGLLVTLPVLSIFIWQYIQPALLQNEQNFITKYILSIFLFTTIAIVFGFYFLIPSTLHFLLEFTPKNTEILLTANEYMSFLFGLLMMMVLVFQTPIVVFGLIRTGLVEKQLFISKRKEIYFGILVFMAAFGSPDIITWIISAIPVIILFESALTLASKKTKPL